MSRHTMTKQRVTLVVEVYADDAETAQSIIGAALKNVLEVDDVTFGECVDMDQEWAERYGETPALSGRMARTDA